MSYGLSELARCAMVVAVRRARRAVCVSALSHTILFCEPSHIN